MEHGLNVRETEVEKFNVHNHKQCFKAVLFRFFTQYQ